MIYKCFIVVLSTMFSSALSVYLFLQFIHFTLTLNATLNYNFTNGESLSKSFDNLTHSHALDDDKLSKNSSANVIAKSSKSFKKAELIYDYDEDYDDEGDEESGENGIGRSNAGRRRRIFIIKRVGATYAWGRWEKWSRCSNSCVQIRKRQCIKRIQNATDSEALEVTFYPNLADETTGCFGIMKKYRLCKDEKCKFSNRQMRDEQCSTYNRQSFKGKFYSWQGYEKEHNECELYCKPIDSDIFISMNQSVTDGTPCEKPAIYYTHYYRRKAVCVEGICKVFESFFFSFS